MKIGERKKLTLGERVGRDRRELNHKGWEVKRMDDLHDWEMGAKEDI